MKKYLAIALLVLPMSAQKIILTPAETAQAKTLAAQPSNATRTAKQEQFNSVLRDKYLHIESTDCVIRGGSLL